MEKPLSEILIEAFFMPHRLFLNQFENQFKDA